MKHTPRVVALGIVVFAGLWITSANHLVSAQNTSAAPQRQLLMINEISLKPDTAPEWAELMKSDGVPAQKKSGLAWRDTWANGPGGDPYLRAVVTPIASLAQFDNPNPMMKALGQEGAAAYQAKVRRLVAGSHSTIVTTRPDLSFGTRPEVPKLALLSIVNAASGKGPEFEAFLKSDVIPALKKGGASHYSVVQVLFGDDANKYMTLLAVNDFAELAKGSPIERALGPEGMVKLTQKAGPLVSRLERRIIRYLPDLSYGPATPTSD